MFKVGEIVYCIDTDHIIGVKDGYKIKYLELDKPYIVKKHYSINIILEGVETVYMSGRFISEKNYQISKRKEKLSKIKECLKEVI